MLESAPLDVTEATVGYELDAITLRTIASTRYVRHHEWLDHVLGSPLPTSAIVPSKISSSLSLEDIESQIKRAKEEIAELEIEKEAGWSFHLDEDKTKVLSNAIHELRSDFGSGSSTAAREQVENALGLKMVSASPMRSVNIRYDRQVVDMEQARVVLEKQQKQQENEAQPAQNTAVNDSSVEQLNSPISNAPTDGGDTEAAVKEDADSAMVID